VVGPSPGHRPAPAEGAHLIDPGNLRELPGSFPDPTENGFEIGLEATAQSSLLSLVPNRRFKDVNFRSRQKDETGHRLTLSNST